MNPASLYHKLNDLLGTMGGWLRSPLLLLIRLYWGWQFFLTGKGKLLHLDRTTDYFASLDLPAPKLNAILAGSTECVFGLLFLAGLGGRVVPLPLIGLLTVAYLTSEQEAVHAIFSHPDKFVTADPFLFLLAAVIVLVFGPGQLALDTLFSRKTSSGE